MICFVKEVNKEEYDHVSEQQQQQQRKRAKLVDTRPVEIDDDEDEDGAERNIDSFFYIFPFDS